MVIVADDVAEYGSSTTQQRGLAGTVFVHKVESV
jgi:dihydroxyacetone kinase